jgi:hypothetical protein
MAGGIIYSSMFALLLPPCFHALAASFPSRDRQASVGRVPGGWWSTIASPSSTTLLVYINAHRIIRKRTDIIPL